MNGPVTPSAASGVTRADGEGRAVCAEGNPWNPDFTCAKDAGHDGDHWSPTATGARPEDEPWTEDEYTTALDLVYAWLGADRAARNLVVRPEYVTLTRNVAAAIAAAWDDGFDTGGDDRQEPRR